MEQKQKYAVWKAAEIRKALKEGRKPTTGPPTGDDNLSVPVSPSSDRFFSHFFMKLYAFHLFVEVLVPIIFLTKLLVLCFFLSF